MGLFLQKTNIIRDYLEDYVDGRAFWPQDVWKKHAKTGQLGEFALPQFRSVANALDKHSTWYKILLTRRFWRNLKVLERSWTL